MELLLQLALLGVSVAILIKLNRISDQLSEVSDKEMIDTISSKVESMTEQVKSIIE
jgi:hypothetical protein